jgi:NAD-dependent SIR2 family protein deacetylase
VKCLKCENQTRKKKINNKIYDVCPVCGEEYYYGSEPKFPDLNNITITELKKEKNEYKTN